ncbi:FMN reductase [Devosia nitrariae]|uniref:FMN reductase n=1 Tax=Devosia nitrariae TaxID=2071872 RepID=A0ABQ5WCT3_9HYPH|nr:FMN reductase [Devosia nitrariae]GLQ57720.1 FMN reductase [Devosia nitrariae]
MTLARQKIVAFTGNTRRPSRSLNLAEAIARRIQAHMDADYLHVDVLSAGPGLGAALTRQQLTPEALAVVEAVEEADILIAVSPVYKGSYTGLFKHLFDFVDMDALIGRPVVVGATGGGPRHSLVVEHQMRPLFGFFSALTIPTAVYAEDASFEDDRLADPAVLARVEAAAIQCAQLAEAIGGRRRRGGRADEPESGRIIPLKG